MIFCHLVYIFQVLRIHGVFGWTLVSYILSYLYFLIAADVYASCHLMFSECSYGIGVI